MILFCRRCVYVRPRLLARWALLAAVLVMPQGAQAAAPKAPSNEDWPAWRGPLRNGLCTEQGLARKWPKEGPPLVWKVENIGDGYSTPSVAGGAIYVMGNRDGKEYVFALDRSQQGKELWAAAIGPVRHDGAGYPGPRSTPTVEGDRVYALGMNGDLVALEAKTGRLVWSRDLVKEFAGTIPSWGYSESVLIDGPWLLCTPGGGQATLAALDKQTGKTVWQSPVGNGAGYASIIVATIDGVKQYVQFTAQGVVGVQADNGKFLWRYDAPANGTANISTPVVAGNEVFAASGYGTGGGLVELAKAGAEWKANQAYFTKAMKNHHGGLLLVDGFLYGSNDPGLLTCLDFKSGKEMWADRGPGKCSVVFADGLIVARSEEGKVSLVEATPGQFTMLGSFEQPNRSGRPAWPHPVVAGGELYLRDQNVLMCYELRGGK